jgi:tetratricopeptide (TPR) repeat protein
MESQADLAPSREEQIAALKAIDEQSQALQKESKLMEALQTMEKSLILRGHVFGLDSPEVMGACKSVAEMCNYLAMTYLQTDEFEVVLELLKKAEVLSEKHKAVLAVTYNNLGCYHRKRGKLRTALASVRKAIAIESNMKEGAARRADTHLNMCTILSELDRHDQAINHARTALKLLLMEMFGPDGIASKAEAGDEPPKLPADRVAVLAIAYHNLAVQQEHLKKYRGSLSSYEKACKVAATHLPEGHPLVDNLKESFVAARDKLSSLILREEQHAINSANKKVGRKGRAAKKPEEDTARAGGLTSEELRSLQSQATPEEATAA